MTNWEWMISDKKRFAKILMDGDFLATVIDPWWCRGVCPHRVNGECTAEETDYEVMCGNDAAIIMMYLDAEHKD